MSSDLLELSRKAADGILGSFKSSLAVLKGWLRGLSFTSLPRKQYTEGKQRRQAPREENTKIIQVAEADATCEDRQNDNEWLSQKAMKTNITVAGRRERGHVLVEDLQHTTTLNAQHGHLSCLAGHSLSY